MKKFAFILASAAFLQGCSQSKPASATSAMNGENVKNTIILGEFYDNVTPTTFEESKLRSLPKIVNLADDMTPVKNQSDRGTCTFFSVLGLTEATVKKDLGIEVNFSEEYLNYITKNEGYSSKVEGSNVYGNIDAMERRGLLLERDLSYQPSWFQKGLPCEKYKATDSSAPANCFSHNAPDKKTATKIIPASGLEFNFINKNTNSIIEFLAREKRPLTLDVVVNFNGWPDTGDVFYNEELRQECLNETMTCGGHSILLTGYDMDKKVFFFKNSWGKEWGQSGFGTITFNTVDRYANNNLYYAKANSDELQIPEDYKKDDLRLKDFSSTVSTKLDSSVNVNMTGGMDNIRGRFVYVSSFMVKKLKGVDEIPTDKNVTVVTLPDGEKTPTGDQVVKSFKFFPVVNDVTSLSWEFSNPLVLNFPASIFRLPTVSNLMDSETEDSFLRTTIYVHTDDQSYKVLKRFYQPIKQ